MKTPLGIIIIGLGRSLLSRATFFANESGADTFFDAVTDMFVANEAKDGWVQLSPFGEFDNAQGMQKFTREDADAIVNEFDSLKNLPQRVFGLPWYIGHPDHPRFKEKYKDTKAYGRIKALEVRDEGLFANVKWSAAGRQLVEGEAFHGHSVNWRVKKVGNVFHPISLKSVGFTNDPQIPVQPALANENENTTTMPKWIIDLLIAAGLLKADAAPTEDEAKALLSPIITAAGKLPAAEQAKKTAETALANEVTAHTATKGKLSTAETTFANERKAHVASLLAVAEREGRIKPSDRSKWEGDFANEFDATTTKLAAEKPLLKTDRSVGDLSNRKAVTKTATAKVQEFVNEAMSKDPAITTLPEEDRYRAAFGKVRDAHPELFTNDSK